MVGLRPKVHGLELVHSQGRSDTRIISLRRGLDFHTFSWQGTFFSDAGHDARTPSVHRFARTALRLRASCDISLECIGSFLAFVEFIGPQTENSLSVWTPGNGIGGNVRAGYRIVAAFLNTQRLFPRYSLCPKLPITRATGHLRA